MSIPVPGLETVEANILTFDQVKNHQANVNIGDTVTGFSGLTELDLLVSYLAAQRLHLGWGSRSYLDESALRLQSNSGKVKIPLWNNINMLPSVALQPRMLRGQMFLGKLINTSVTLISEDVPRNYHGLMNTSGQATVSFLLGANVYSTGRGVIGNSSRLLVLQETNDGIGRRSRSVSYTDLQEHNADLATQLLVADGQSTARILAINNLNTAFSAGLPGHGKHG